MADATIVDLIRTRFGGALSSVRPDGPAAAAIPAPVGRRPGLAVDAVVLGAATAGVEPRVLGVGRGIAIALEAHRA